MYIMTWFCLLLNRIRSFNWMYWHGSTLFLPSPPPPFWLSICLHSCPHLLCTRQLSPSLVQITRQSGWQLMFCLLVFCRLVSAPGEVPLCLVTIGGVESSAHTTLHTHHITHTDTHTHTHTHTHTRLPGVYSNMVVYASVWTVPWSSRYMHIAYLQL